MMRPDKERMHMYASRGEKRNMDPLNVLICSTVAYFILYMCTEYLV